MFPIISSNVVGSPILSSYGDTYDLFSHISLPSAEDKGIHNLLRFPLHDKNTQTKYYTRYDFFSENINHSLTHSA